MPDIIMRAKTPNMPGDNSFNPFSAKEFELLVQRLPKRVLHTS